MKNRLSSTVLVIFVPLLILAVLGLITGAAAIGIPEIVLLLVVWSVGLWRVWRRR